jgi:hypothetical protein
MPIEIRELTIKAFVNETPQQPSQGGGGGQTGAQDRDQIISACVEQVLQILKDKKER